MSGILATLIIEHRNGNILQNYYYIMYYIFIKFNNIGLKCLQINIKIICVIIVIQLINPIIRYLPTYSREQPF